MVYSRLTNREYEPIVLPENNQVTATTVATTVVADWPWHVVRAAILRRGLSLAEIAVQAGYQRATARCLSREPLPRLQAAVAAAIGYSPLAIWPSRYAPDGAPLARRAWQQRLAAAREAGTLVSPAVLP